MKRRSGLAGIGKGSVDICMIDGVHDSGAVWDDALSVLCLLKPGGWMLFDDVENRIEKQHHVKKGLSMFLAEKGSELALVAKHNYMAIYRKL